ncbi:precorrin-8X methylmutase [Hippea alviniae]|uniref:precorrin-8X methylmutase n=1 Tax=Hippea alviniae TaxID=1279027 RepID=UPI0004206BCA|nr:precorrin-8X methylmutase [Hippea alviniae]
MKGLSIEKRSFEIIEKKARLDGFTDKQKEIVKRVIHASGDIEIAKEIVFSKNAIEMAEKSIKERWSVVCDVNMVVSGITESLADKFNLKLYSFVHNRDIIERAERENRTRAEVSIEVANDMFDKILFVIGNSPTALLKIIELHDEGKLKESFIIAFPVGFVDAYESKKRLTETDLEYITNLSTKGGSPWAAAAFRAILKL